MPVRYVCHCDVAVHSLAKRAGWLVGANYREIRKFRRYGSLDFLDIDWNNYDFDRHLYAVKMVRPRVTVVKDIVNADDLDKAIRESEKLLRYCRTAVLVPKDIRLKDDLTKLVFGRRILGYSVPTRHGGTVIPPEKFVGPVHLLGGRPDQQLSLSRQMSVYSLDCNRFTLDAGFGDYFDGETFRPHPIGGYYNCIADSLDNINKLWRTRPDIAEKGDGGN